MSDIMAAQTEMSEETGFSFYSGMLSLGACTGIPPSHPPSYLYFPGYLLTALDWAKFGVVFGGEFGVLNTY